MAIDSLTAQPMDEAINGPSHSRIALAVNLIDIIVRLHRRPGLLAGVLTSSIDNRPCQRVEGIKQSSDSFVDQRVGVSLL